MKSFSCILMLILIVSVELIAQEEQKKDFGRFEVSKGEPVRVSRKGFEITPPMGWEIYRKFPGASLLLQVPYEEGQKYQRTIQVMTFATPQYMDDYTADNFGKKIIRKFSKASASIRDYRMRNFMFINLTNGNDGILFYTEFKLGELNMMQAHVLTSSATNHYLITFTDLEEHFEGKKSTQYLTEAWESMVSFQSNTAGPKRFSTPLFIGFALAFVLLIGIMFWYLRVNRDRKEMVRIRSNADEALKDVQIDDNDKKDWNVAENDVDHDDDDENDMNFGDKVS